MTTEGLFNFPINVVLIKSGRYRTKLRYTYCNIGCLSHISKIRGNAQGLAFIWFLHQMLSAGQRLVYHKNEQIPLSAFPPQTYVRTPHFRCWFPVARQLNRCKCASEFHPYRPMPGPFRPLPRVRPFCSCRCRCNSRRCCTRCRSCSRVRARAFSNR